jgi:hypothetical protein
LDEERGVFCTLKNYALNTLRGCIGLPYPTKPLAEAVVDAAISSATSDPRFKQVSLDEFAETTVELTVLTPPSPLDGKREEFPKQVEVGKHGLIVKKGFASGLLLPQVATENNWDSEKFLEMTCWKAGLPNEAWKQKDCEVYTFEGQIFREKEPQGKILQE